ncbi:hypothetical protein L6R52_43070, partial [Myxococcota bacterium]|nr:hypothetical protein [Myxococcota bacterium]
AERPRPRADRAALERRAIDVPHARDVLPRMIGALPRGVPAAIYVPNIDLALADIELALDALRLVQPSLHGRRAGAILARLLGQRTGALNAISEGTAIGDDEATDQRWAHLATPSGLASIGIDVEGGAAIVPSGRDDALALVFELSNRPRFEAWMSSLARGAERRLAVGAEQASVLEPADVPPVTCLSRQSVAYCQLGASSGPDPIALLRAISSLAPPTLAQVPGLSRAFERLPDGAHAYLVVSPDQAARVAAEMIGERAHREHRFDPPAVKRAVAERASRQALGLRRAAELVDGVAIGLYPERERVRLRTEISVTERGARTLRALFTPTGDDDVVARWAETPALARLVLRLGGPDAEALFTELGLALPTGSLSGTVSLLFLGVDPESPLTRPDREPGLFGWSFLVPSALAAGLRSPEAVEAVHEHIGRTLAGVEAPRTALAAPLEPIVGRAFDSPWEVRFVDGVVLAGTGPGSAAAAERRLGALRDVALPLRADDAPVIEGAVHLRAIDAALGPSGFPADSRRELRVADAVRMKLRPLLDQVEGVRFEVRAMQPERRLRVDVALVR